MSLKAGYNQTSSGTSVSSIINMSCKVLFVDNRESHALPKVLAETQEKPSFGWPDFQQANLCTESADSAVLSDSQITAKNSLHNQGTHHSAAKNGKNILLDSFEENATLNCVGSQEIKLSSRNSQRTVKFCNHGSLQSAAMN